MAAAHGTVFQQAQNAGNAVGKQVKSEVVNTAVAAREQIGLPHGENALPQAPIPEEPFDIENYRSEVARRDQEALARLQALLAEMRNAGQIRAQNEQSYHQNVDSQMRSADQSSFEAVSRQVQADSVPQAVKAKQGTGEAKRQHKG